MALVLLLDQLTPTPRLIFGKASVNVLPPGEDGKGPASLALMRHLRQTGLFFIGDDETDEDVFELSEGLVMGVRVGAHEKSQARYFINHQGEIKDILRFLIDCIDRAQESSASGESDMIGTEKRADDH
jgi:trehalose 6-phosphate phosphatase